MSWIVYVAALGSASTVVLGLLCRQAARDRASARAVATSARRAADEARRVAVETRAALARAKTAKDDAIKEHNEQMKRIQAQRAKIKRASSSPEELAQAWSDAFDVIK